MPFSRLLVLRAFLLYLPSPSTTLAQPPQALPEDLTAIQAAVERLIIGVNNRDAKAVHAVTTPSFDASGESFWLNRDGRPWFPGASPDRRYDGVEVAALVRGGRLITPDAALAGGYFRTINWPGGTELAGYLNMTLIKRDGQWLAEAARFAAYRFADRSTFMVKPAKVHMPPGQDGWIRLFDGKSLDAFTGTGDDPVSGCWSVENELLTLNPAGCDSNRGIRTKDTFRSFELRFDWRVPPKGNSGVKYRLFYLTQGDGTGHEYQIADDAGDPGAAKYANQRTGSLYNQIPPSKAAPRAVGEWNSSTIIVRGRHCEHWLNGEKVVEYETSSRPLEGPLLLQNHRTRAWFRNVLIRRLD